MHGSTEIRNSPRSPELFAGAAVAAVACVRLALFLAATPDQQIGLIPDDAFYYFIPARNFAQHGVWSFDGQAPTSGFHLLYGYSLAALFAVWPDISYPVLLALVGSVSTALLAAAAVLTARAVSRDFAPTGVLGVVLVATLGLALAQQTLFVESCLVIFFASALLALLSRGEASPLRLAAAFALGLAANLARSDFGLLPAACAVTTFALRGRAPRARAQLALAAAALLGAAAGVACVALHTYAWSGSFVQGSARTKHRWSQAIGYDVFGLIRLLVELVWFPHTKVLGVISAPALLVAAGLAAAAARARTGAARLTEWPLLWGCAGCVVGYVLLYGESSAGVPQWYLANVLPALAYLAGAGASLFDRRALPAVIALVALSALVNLRATLLPLWTHQVAMKAAGEYLHAHPEITGVGAWNSGMIAWFAGRPVVNLDGLVNDEIEPYAKSGQLLEYLCRRKIDHLVDFAVMLELGRLTRRNGLSDGRLRAQLIQELDFSQGRLELRMKNTDLRLYRLAPGACASLEGAGEVVE